MQGFNMGRYIRPDLEGTTTFNKASGKRFSSNPTVRFECPFAIWCTNCKPEQIIAQGVRFNATKTKVGNYYSTPIWSFKIKHNVCGGIIEVQTDPKNTEYIVISGGRRRDLGEAKLLEGEILIGGRGGKPDEGDAFASLERKTADKELAKTQEARVGELRKRSERDWADPYEMNQRIRRAFRTGRRDRQANDKSALALQEKYGLGLDLKTPAQEDVDRARLIEFGRPQESNVNSKAMLNPTSAVQIKAQKERGKRGRPEQATAKEKLQNSLKVNAGKKMDPFLTDGPRPTRRELRDHAGSPAGTNGAMAALVDYDSE